MRKQIHVLPSNPTFQAQGDQAGRLILHMKLCFPPGWHSPFSPGQTPHSMIRQKLHILKEQYPPPGWESYGRKVAVKLLQKYSYWISSGSCKPRLLDSSGPEREIGIRVVVANHKSFNFLNNFGMQCRHIGCLSDIVIQIIKLHHRILFCKDIWHNCFPFSITHCPVFQPVSRSCVLLIAPSVIVGIKFPVEELMLWLLISKQ